MLFDPDNPIVKLCAQGMEMEGSGKPEIASGLFHQAWNEAANHFEKFTAAHYVARHQQNTKLKLKWDETALEHALLVKNEDIADVLPSLYLNIAKCYEDLGNKALAEKNYQLGLTHSSCLPETGYSKFIKNGILAGLRRLYVICGDE